MNTSFLQTSEGAFIMAQPLVEITAGTVRYRHRPVGEQVQSFLRLASRVRYIVVSEFRAKVFDKALGVFWLLLEPIITAMLYYVLTVVVLGAKVEENHFLFIYVAVVFWRWFSRSFDGSPTVFSGYAAVLKHTTFPALALLMSYMAIEVVFFLFGFIVLMIFLASYGIYPASSFLYLPFVMLVEFCFALGFVLLFAVMGTFFKDLSAMLYAITSIWFYLSPGIYPVSRVPAEYMWLYNMNPFVHLLTAYRDIILNHRAPEMAPLLLILGCSLIFDYLGIKLLSKARYHFFMYL